MTSTDVRAVGAGARARVARAPARQRQQRRRTLTALLFCAPGVVLYSAFVLLPLGLAVYYSLYRWNGISALDNFVGLKNYRDALADEGFTDALKHNGLFVLLSLGIQGPLALGIAVLLNTRIRGRAALRTIVFAPYVLSEVIAGVIWLLILQPAGLVDTVLEKVGLGRLAQLWLADPSVVLYTLFAVITWKYIGFAVILFLAGLQGIPVELAEAAEVDGASPWARFRGITLPLMAPTIRVWAFLSIIGTLQLFDLVWIMTLGGPAGASHTMVTYLGEFGFKRSRFGFGSAIATILFIISFAFSLAYQRFVLRRDTDGALTQ